MPVMWFHPAPRPHPALIAHISTYLDKRGPAWAKEVMVKAAPWSEWPANLRQRIRALEAKERSDG